MLDLGLLSRTRIQLVRQTEIAECGLACLTMIANFYGLRVDIGTMRRRFAPSLRGASLRTLMAVGDKIGLSCRAVRAPLEEIAYLALPAVLHWDLSHYVVAERVKGGKVLIHNPDGRSVWMTLDQISPHFTGVVLELKPATSFEPRNIGTRLRLSQLWQSMSGIKRALVQTLVLSVILQVFALASPYYMQIAIDRVVPALDGNLLAVLAIGFAIFTFINVVASFLRSFVLLAVGTSVGYGLTSSIGNRLFKLPIEWFEKRNTGDILSRFQSISPIRAVLTQSAVSAFLDGLLAIFTLVMMIIYSTKLAVVALVAFALYAIVRIVSFSFEKTAQEASIVARGKEQTMLIETLRGITTLRLFGAELDRHSLWLTRLTDSMNADARAARIGIWQSSANSLIFGIENVVTIWLAVSLVISGDAFSVGMVFAYMSYKSQFMGKAGALIDQAIAFRMLNLHLERLSDIALTQPDRCFEGDDFAGGKMIGAIAVRNLSFRYSAADPFVLQNVNFEVAAGEHIAITGPSGGGKTTLGKLILGLIDPTDGAVLIDGIPLDKFGHRTYRANVAAVLQNDSLFAGSIADNIALFDDAPDQDKIRSAAMAASIHHDIAAMPMQYETLVGEMGSTLSGGQVQRVLLARALYREPQVLVMDEGTSHLDAVHEAAVNTSIKQLGITRIIIAHRQETILAADRILFLAGGQLWDVPAEMSQRDSK